MLILKKFSLFSALCALVFLFSGCLKNKTCEPNSPSSEAAQIQAFAAANGINAVAHSSGVYYEIVNPGNGGFPNQNSKIVITYVGKLLNGEVFDRQDAPNTTAWPLSGLIEGWRIGIPLIQRGGSIRLIVPSALAYGCEPYQGLPADAILYFEVQLIDIQ